MDSEGYFTNSDLLDYEKASKKAIIFLNNFLNIYCSDKSFKWMIADRIKSLESINDKINKKKKAKGDKFDPKLDLLDIAGLRVVFCDKDNLYPCMEKLDESIHSLSPLEFYSEFEESKKKEDNYNVAHLYDFVETLMRECDRVAIVKDYIMYQKESGYQSLHVIIDVPVETRDKNNYLITRNCPVEIQFRNYTQHLFNECEHDVRYKGSRKNVAAYEGVFNDAKKFLLNVSNYAITDMLSDDKQYLLIRDN